MRKIYKKNDIVIKLIFCNETFFYTITKNNYIIMNDSFWLNFFYIPNNNFENLKYEINKKNDCKDYSEYIVDCLNSFLISVQKTYLGY